MSWYVYIAKTKTGRYYAGITKNSTERIIKHNQGKGSQLARQQGPFALIYTSKPFPTKSEARKREVQLKRWSRKKKEKLINGEWE